MHRIVVKRHSLLPIQHRTDGSFAKVILFFDESARRNTFFLAHGLSGYSAITFPSALVRTLSAAICVHGPQWG